MQTQIKKNIKKHGYTIAASIIIALSACLRLFFIAHNWPLTNSDEGTVGLMALHITHLKDFPAYFYGQGTMGSLEAYVGALMFPLFGPTVLALRVGVLLLFVLFLISMYLLTSLLYTRGLALLTLILLSLGSDQLLFREYPAFAGHAETPLFGALLVLVATRLVLSSPTPDGSPIRPRRLVGYGFWGCLVGAAFWNDPLTTSFVLTSGLFLLFFCRHELRSPVSRHMLRSPVVLSILTGLLIGLLPVIMYSLTVPSLDQSPLSVVGYLFSTDRFVASDSIFIRLMASLLVTLPVSTGATPLCPMTAQNAWPLSAQSSPQVWQCTAIHGIWALALVIFWLLGIAIAIRLLRPIWKLILMNTATFEQRRDAIIQAARLMLLGSALLTFLTFAFSIQSITGPWSHHRYLIAFGVVTPAILWPLWQIFSSPSSLRWFMALPVKLLCLTLIIFYTATMAVGTLQTTEQIPHTEASLQSHMALVSGLLQLHVTHIYTDYWTCDTVAFLSQEQITCSVLDDNLRPGVNRYIPYVSAVAHDPQAAYVFQIGSPQSKILASQIKRKDPNPRYYHITSLDNYLIYQR